MDKKTHALAARIRAINPTPHVAASGLLTGPAPQVTEDRLPLLRGAYAGQTAFILTCGPSLDDVLDDQLQDLLSDQLVISVKQSIDKLRFAPDFHLYNEVRQKRYEYASPDTLRLSVSQFMVDHPSHLHFPLNGYKYDNALFVTNDYEKWAIDGNITRPWGVGIVFELGLHLPIWLGCRAVVIIGFDMNPTGRYHFYDQSADAKDYQVDVEEFEYARKSSEMYHKWARKKGVEAVLCSPKSALSIPQISKDLISAYLPKG